MMRIGALSVSIVAASKWQPSSPMSDVETRRLFNEWQNQFGVNGADFDTWHTELRAVVEHNARAARGDESWTAGLNKWSAMTWEEKQAHFFLEPQDCSATTEPQTLPKVWYGSDVAPDAKDWRNDIPIHVKNQGSCGSCWTFSTTGAMEAHNYLATGKDVLLAEQQLVDCAGAFDNHGCNGGLPSHAFEYLHYFGGQMKSSDYKYTARDGNCKADVSKVAATVTSQVNITYLDEDQLYEAVGKNGPVSIAYQCASDFSRYAGGVYDSSVCRNGKRDVNHAVLVVGYGHDTKSGKDYWIVKNSWGSSFGIEGGYFWMVRGKNMCGIADCAAFPIVGGEPTPTPTPAPTPPGPCHAISALVTDDWCTANCHTGFCPSDLCQCDSGALV
jgi:cathepsin H